MKNFSRGALTLTLILLLSLGLAALAAAAPPGLVRKTTNGSPEVFPPGLAGKEIPPGLVEKGGLPPGLQGREVLPPGIRLRFAEALRNRVEQGKEAVKMVLKGQEQVVIPAEGAVTVNYAALLVDKENKETKVDAAWSLQDATPGVSLDTASGVLLVTSLAGPQTITLQAVYNEGESQRVFTAKLDVELYKQKASAIELKGEALVTFQAGATGPLTLTYSATVKDQKGTAMPGEAVSWFVITQDYEDISISIDGDLTVVVPPRAGSFTVKATCGQLSDTLEVKVYIPQAYTLEILGKDFVALQEGQESLSLTYTALVRDQEGKVMENAAVAWSADPVAGLVLDKGKVTLTQLPGAGEETVFTLKATHTTGDNLTLSAQKAVKVYHPVATSIVIAGEEEVILPEEGQKVEAVYTAAVLDQYGQEIATEEVVWLLSPQGGSQTPIPWATLDKGVLTVTDEAEAGTLWIWAVSDNLFAVFVVRLSTDSTRA